MVRHNPIRLKTAIESVFSSSASQPNLQLVRTGRKRRTISHHRAGPPHSKTLDRMITPSRRVLVILLPAISWSFLVLIYTWVWLNDYRPHNSPSDNEVLASQVTLVAGGFLCLASFLIAAQGLYKRQLGLVSLVAAIASAAFLFWWFPYAAHGLLRRMHLFV